MKSDTILLSVGARLAPNKFIRSINQGQLLALIDLLASNHIKSTLKA